MSRFSPPEIPRPKTFLGFMSLRTGAEMITLSILINKVSGVYGLLAILTGVHLSALQLSMYIYSIIALVITVYLYRHIRLRTPLQCLALAYLYTLDSIINAAYTAAFGVAWFLVLATHPEDSSHIPGSGTINDTAGFTSPETPVSEIVAVPSPAAGLAASESTAMLNIGEPSSSPTGLRDAVFQNGGIMSIATISALWAARLYLILVMLAFARSVLRQHIATTSSPAAWTHDPTPGGDSKPPSTSTNLAENPFAESREEGAGWQGKLGRLMLRVGPSFWLGADDEETRWANQLGGRFSRRTRLETPSAPEGTVERERRRRSGTGPPAPPKDLPAFVGEGR